MAEEKEKTTKTKKINKTEETSAATKANAERKKSKVKTISEWKDKTIKELKIELQKLTLEVKTGREQNTALVRKLRKHIAKILTQANMPKVQTKASAA